MRKIKAVLISVVLFSTPVMAYSEDDLYELSHIINAEAGDGYTVWKKSDPEAPGILTWNIPIGSENMLYVYFPVLSQRSGYVYLNDRLIGKTIDPDNYGMIPLGTFEPESSISVSLQFNADSISLLDPLFFYENQEVTAGLFDRKINSLSNVKKISSSHITGDISGIEENRWLLLTIPYTNEWKIKINGKSVDTEKVMNSLTAVPLEAGDNHLEMRYRPMGLLPGAAISLMSLPVLILIERKRKKVTTAFCG